MELKLNIQKEQGSHIRKLFVFLLFLTFALVDAHITFAQEMETVTGIIQGANCVHNKDRCPENNIDLHISIERDFVLLMPAGDHYFLPNLDRAIKARYVNKTAKIRGIRDGHGIWVETMEIKTDGNFRQVWSLKEEEKKYQGTN